MFYFATGQKNSMDLVVTTDLLNNPGSLVFNSLLTSDVSTFNARVREFNNRRPWLIQAVKVSMAL